MIKQVLMTSTAILLMASSAYAEQWGAVAVGMNGKQIQAFVSNDHPNEDAAKYEALSRCQNRAKDYGYRVTCKVLDTFNTCGYIAIKVTRRHTGYGTGDSAGQAQSNCRSTMGAKCEKVAGACNSEHVVEKKHDDLQKKVHDTFGIKEEYRKDNALKACNGYGLQDGKDDEETIAACTIIAESSKYSDLHRAIAFLVRGHAKYRNADDEDSDNKDRARNGFDEAIKDINDSIRLFPSAEAFLTRGIIYQARYNLQLGDKYDDNNPPPRADLDLAVTDFTQALVRNELVPEKERSRFWSGITSISERAYNDRGEAYTTLRNWKGCISDFQYVHRLNREAGVTEKIGDCAYNAKDWELAIKSYEDAIKEDPKSEWLAKQLVRARDQKEKEKR